MHVELFPVSSGMHDGSSACLFFSGCYPSSGIPLVQIQYTAEQKQQTLVVFLPGRDDSVTIYQKQGFVEAVKDRGLPIDMVALNAHIGYYLNRSIISRLKEDVIEPAKRKGYEHIWIVGDSMGAYGAISYLKTYPKDITVIVLLGPFLGEELLISEIKKAGGLQKWDPGEIKPASKSDWERSIWAWFRECEIQGKCYQGIYLG